MAGERRPGLIIQLLLFAALQARIFRDVFLDDGLNVGGKPFPGGKVREHVESRPHVICDADVLHHFVVFEKMHVRQRIFLRIDGARLQRFIDSAAVDRDGNRAQCLEHIIKHRPRGDAHAQPHEILGARDRTFRPAHLPHPVVESAAREAMDIFRSHLLAQVRSQRTIHRLMRMRRRTKSERHLLNLGRGHDITENSTHQRVELDFTRDEHLQRLGIAAGNPVVFRKHRRFDAPADLVANGCPHLAESQVMRAVCRLIVILNDSEVRSPDCPREYHQ